MSSRYIAGETLDDAVNTVRALNADGLMATLDVLGEFVSTEAEAHRAGQEYLDALDVLHAERLDSNVSIKLTQMGLTIDPELCYRVTEKVVARARELGNFVRIDMEDSSVTTSTLDVYRRLRDRHPGRVGCVIQAYLHRSADDIRALVAESANVRLCKGIYRESPTIAYKDPEAIRSSYTRLLGDLLDGGAYTGIATHDVSLVEAAFGLIRDRGLDPSVYEFQMLLGVTEALRARILAEGHRLRVYVPFGSHWYAYSLRRLKENPAIAGHILRNLFPGKD